MATRPEPAQTAQQPNPILVEGIALAPIGNLQDARGGLAVLRIGYSDGSQGVLTVSCNLSDAPDVFEGVTATKGVVSYWNPGEESPTLFHVVK